MPIELDKQRPETLNEIDIYLAEKIAEFTMARDHIAELRKTLAPILPGLEATRPVSPASTSAQTTSANASDQGANEEPEKKLPSSLQEAVVEVVKVVYGKQWAGVTCKQVTDYLTNCRFKSNAKDLYSSVSVTLKRMTNEKGLLRMDNSGGRAKYFPISADTQLSAVNGSENGATP